MPKARRSVIYRGIVSAHGTTKIGAPNSSTARGGPYEMLGRQRQASTTASYPAAGPAYRTRRGGRPHHVTRARRSPPQELFGGRAATQRPRSGRDPWYQGSHRLHRASTADEDDLTVSRLGDDRATSPGSARLRAGHDRCPRPARSGWRLWRSVGDGRAAGRKGANGVELGWARECGSSRVAPASPRPTHSRISASRRRGADVAVSPRSGCRQQRSNHEPSAWALVT